MPKPLAIEHVDTVLKIPLHLLFYIALGTLSYLKLCTNSREEPYFC